MNTYGFRPSIFDDYSDNVVVYKDDVHKNITSEKSSDKDAKLFMLCFYQNENDKELETYIHQQIYDYTKVNYQSLTNAIMSHDIGEFFNIPYFSEPIMRTPLFVNIKYFTIMSYNATNIHEKIFEIQKGQTSNLNFALLANYYANKVQEFLSDIFSKFSFFLGDHIRLELFQLIYSKAYIEIIKNIDLSGNLNSKENYYYFASESSGYFSSIDYANDNFSLLSIGENEDYYHCEGHIINNYLYFMNKRLLKSIDINFIPLNYGNNTILSEELCFLFLLKVNNFNIDSNYLNELSNKIKKRQVSFENCLTNKNRVYIKPEIQDILNINFSSYLLINSLFYKGITHLENDDNDFPYYFIRYTYPNFNILKDFKSEYLILDQVNYYLFSSFREPIKYSNTAKQVLENCFYLIVYINIFIWIICIAINLTIFSKIINNWIQPIINLQESIESNSIKDKNIFKYEHDDIINELFCTCKELLFGQINNTKSDLNNFNITENNKNRKIDENRYKKNLIIDNDLMNQLINQQQNMMDFSKNILLNDPKNKSKNQKINKKSKLTKHKLDEEIIKNSSAEGEKNSKIISNNAIKTDINKKIDNYNNEIYKKLFKIGEYIDYYRNKLQPNNIIIIGNNNSIIEENKLTKSVSKQISLNSKNIGGTNDNNDKLYVNMLDEENISYLWYMEEKKKNNKSLNFNISDNYNEMFID